MYVLYMAHICFYVYCSVGVCENVCCVAAVVKEVCCKGCCKEVCCKGCDICCVSVCIVRGGAVGVRVWEM